jgi:hypothetical protein
MFVSWGLPVHHKEPGLEIEMRVARGLYASASLYCTCAMISAPTGHSAATARPEGGNRLSALSKVEWTLSLINK